MIFASDGTPRIGRLSVSTTPQPLELPNPYEKNSQGVLLKILGTNETVYIGVNANVSSSSGYPLQSGEEFGLNLRSTEALWVVASDPCEIAWMAL